MQNVGTEVVHPSFMKQTFDKVGDGFQEILEQVDRVYSKKSVSTVDALALQQSMFHYALYQEIVTKITSKSANAVNEVIKAQ